MEDGGMNHYEQQLYTVFKTFDVDNAEALDRAAVLQLCDALQLEGRGAALVDSLFERRAERVTFATFRNGLLSVLGAEPAPAPAPEHSDDDSSGREVAPKFVFGSKKYGRRSRPARGADETVAPRAASTSRLDADAGGPRARMRYNRSASAMEARATPPPDLLDHERRIDRAQAAALCHDLRMDGIDPRLVDRIFEDASVVETTVGEFFDRLNAALTPLATGQAAPEPPPEPPDADDAEAVVTGEAVSEAWERAGVRRPRRLLAELGFTGATLSPDELERALDDELRALAPRDERDAFPLLQQAALALSRLRRNSARARAAAAAAERDKLRADLIEANRRAQLLAQDVDENHARLEAERLAALRQLEVRHAEATRAVSEEAVAERERAAAQRAELETELTRRGEAEARLRAELAALRLRSEQLERRVSVAEERATSAERERSRAEEDALSAAAMARQEQDSRRAARDALERQVLELREDNARLRDRADELAAGLEAGRARAAVAPPAAAAASWRDEAELDAAADTALDGIELQECDSLSPSMERLVLHAETARRLRALADSLAPACVHCVAAAAALRALAGTPPAPASAPPAPAAAPALASTPPAPAPASAPPAPAGAPPAPAAASAPPALASTPPAPAPASAPPAPAAASAPPALASTPPAPAPASAPPAPAQTAATPTDEDLEVRIQEMQQKHQAEKNDLNNLVAELEGSVEALREEYDRCEEYWAGKLADERALAADEAAASDARLGELLARVAEYEAAFHPRLPALQESEYEAQYEQLAQEFEVFKTEAAQALAVARAELQRVAAPQPAPAPAPACSCQQQAAAPARRPASDGDRRRAPARPAGSEAEPARRSASAEALQHAGAGARAGDTRGRADTAAAAPAPTPPHAAGAPCACAALALAWRRAATAEGATLRARAAHAERAAARLLARLQAADTLVADLYRENCQLQHHARLEPRLL